MYNNGGIQDTTHNFTLQKSYCWLEHSRHDRWIIVIYHVHRTHEPIEGMAMARAACLASGHMCHQLPLLQSRHVSALIGRECRHPFLHKCIKFRGFPKSSRLVYGKVTVASVGTPTYSWHLPTAGLGSRRKTAQECTECTDGSPSSSQSFGQ